MDFEDNKHNTSFFSIQSLWINLLLQELWQKLGPGYSNIRYFETLTLSLTLYMKLS